MQFLHAGPFISNVVGFYAGGAPPREHLQWPFVRLPPIRRWCLKSDISDTANTNMPLVLGLRTPLLSLNLP